jgi:hypothetical protein
MSNQDQTNETPNQETETEMTALNISAATMPQLVAFYNKQTGKAIKKFETLEIARKRVSALKASSDRRPTASASKPKKAKRATPVTQEERAKAISKSWADPKVAAKRKERHGVRVAGVEYKSVGDAFRQLRLPMEKHVKFRQDLKANGDRLKFQDHIFILVPKE